MVCPGRLVMRAVSSEIRGEFCLAPDDALTRPTPTLGLPRSYAHRLSPCSHSSIRTCAYRLHRRRYRRRGCARLSRPPSRLPRIAGRTARCRPSSVGRYWYRRRFLSQSKVASSGRGPGAGQRSDLVSVTGRPPPGAPSPAAQSRPNLTIAAPSSSTGPPPPEASTSFARPTRVGAPDLLQKHLSVEPHRAPGPSKVRQQLRPARVRALATAVGPATATS